MSKPRILSGVQPTGNLHLGNYLGAIRNWVPMQDSHECLFMLADLHAITVPQEPEKLRAHIRETAASYIACGIDPEKSVIFQQSAIAQHSELAWVLGCHTPLGWLNRMTQFKEKGGKDKEKVALGLYSYPVLMAADILLYKATHVPTGEDQKQHVELCRDIAGAFNRAYGREVFPLPEPLIMGEATRVMSLRDGTKKMSKSDDSAYSRIHLADAAEEIALKFRKAKSDLVEGISYEPETRPESSNLVTLYAALSGQSRERALAEVGELNFSAFKQRLSEAAVAHLAPIGEKLLALLGDSAYLDGILASGAEKAGEIAEETMREVKVAVGFL